MLKKSIPFFIITAAALLLIAGLSLFTKAAPQPENTSEELQAQKQLIILYIESANSISAQAEYDNLITDYAGNRFLPAAVYDIAETYRNNSKFKDSLQVYADVVNNWPESSSAVWAQRGLAISNIALGRMQKAQVELDKLQNNYSADPNIAESVFNVADTYYWFKRYDEADSLYRYVSESYPDNDFAMWSQMGLAISFIANGNEPAAADATDKLILNYPDNKKLPEALFYIAGRYAWDKKYNEAQDIYYYIADQFSESEWAKNAEFESAKVAIYPLLDANDEPNSLAAIDNLIIDFADRNDLASAVYDLAVRVDSQNNHNMNSTTEAICLKVIDNFPDSSQSTFSEIIISRMNIVSLIDSNDEPNAINSIDQFVEKFKDHQKTPEFTFDIAQRYYNKARSKDDANEIEEYYLKSVYVREKIINELPVSDFTPQAIYTAAVIYSQELGEYEKGIDYFEAVAVNWPEYEYAWHAQYFVGMYSERLKRSSDVDDPELDEQIEQAYKAVLENYPVSKSAKRSALRLAQINYHREDWSQAAVYSELYRAEYMAAESLENQLSILKTLASIYEKIGDNKLAVEAYVEMIQYIADENDPRINPLLLKIDELEEKE